MKNHNLTRRIHFYLLLREDKNKNIMNADVMDKKLFFLLMERNTKIRYRKLNLEFCFAFCSSKTT